MRANAKWIVTVLVAYYVWAGGMGVFDMVRVGRMSHPDTPLTMPDYYTYSFNRTPQARVAVAQGLGAPVYPDATCEFANWNRWMGRAPDGQGTLDTDAPYADVLAFYATQCASVKPWVRTGATPEGPRTLLLWHDLASSYSVLIRAGHPWSPPVGHHGPPPPPREQRTVIELRRTPIPWPRVATDTRQNQPQQGIAPAALSLPVYPGDSTHPAGTVDYCGWVYTAKGRTAMAQYEVLAPPDVLQGYYSKVAEMASGHGSGGGGNELTQDWDNALGQYEVTIQQPDPALPTIVRIQHVGGGWVQAVLRRLWVLPPLR